MAFDKTQERNRQYQDPKIVRHGGVFGGDSAKSNPDYPIEIFPPPKFYLAGPFFNAEQVNLMMKLEVAFVDGNVPFFTPRMTEHNKKKELDDQDAKEIFKQNVQAILECGAVLAVLDWKMPEDQFLRICHQRYEPLGLEPGPYNLNLPDTGTVWEMGFAFNKRPIYGYTERKPGEKVNIMLTQCLEGVIHGPEALARFLNRGRVRPGEAIKGDWKHR